MGIHLLHCLCGSGRTTTHDTFQNTVVTMVLESGAHIQREVSHLFPCHKQKQVDIVITRNDFWTLANVVIVALTCTDLVQHALLIIAHAITIAVQNKIQFYI